MDRTIQEVYDDYLAWQRQDAARANITFLEYMRTEVCN